MENTSEDRRDTRPRLIVSDFATVERAVSVGRGLRIGALASQNFVSLPGWFPSAKACAVLRLKARRFALLSDETGASRVASLEQLAAAPAERAVAGVAAPFGPAVTPTMTIEQALRLMDTHAADQVGVVSGGVVVGILSREVAAAALAEARDNAPGTYEPASAACLAACLAA